MLGCSSSVHGPPPFSRFFLDCLPECLWQVWLHLWVRWRVTGYAVVMADTCVPWAVRVPLKGGSAVGREDGVCHLLRCAQPGGALGERWRLCRWSAG